MAVNNRTASSRQLAALWSTATGVLMSASSIRQRLLQNGLRARVAFIQNESRFNLWNHDGRISVRRYAGEHCLPECVIERHSGLTTGVMLDNARSYIAKTVRDFCSAQHTQLLPWPAYSPDMSPIEHVWDWVGRRLARNPRPAVSKDELLLRIQAIWNSLPHADIQNLFDSVLRRIAALIAARGGYTKHRFWTLDSVFLL
ncbi:transposable element Tcb2 transposase [Trichonephila clavipes]|nr:transposable element Tcb2 transposase [Trichonephila clavipes]